MNFVSSTVFEVIIAVMLAVGLLFEPMLARIEQVIWYRLTRRRRQRRKVVELHRDDNRRHSA